MSYSVAQNTTFLTVASVAQKIISFAYFLFIASIIDVGDTGQYFFAISFTTIFTVVADFGLGPVLTREAAKYPEKSEAYLATVFFTKCAFGLVAYGLVIFLANLLNYSAETRLLIYLSGITMLFDNLQGSFYSIFRARKNLIYESIGILGSQFLTLVIGTTALLLGFPLYWLIIAYTIPSFLNMVYAGIFTWRVYGLPRRWVFDPAVLKSFLVLAVPFALAGIISRLYSYFDAILMSKLLSPEHLGWWSVPYKITFAFQFIPAALSASVYPAMSSLSITDTSKIGAMFEKSWRYLFIIVFPLALGLVVLAKPFIFAFRGDQYLPSVPVLQILALSLIFGYLSFISGALLNATNHQRTQTILLGVALLTSIALNLVFIPRWGIQGAAVAAVISNIILCSGGFYFARRFVVINGKNIFRYANQALWPAIIMAVVVHYLSQRLHFVVTVPIGALVYGILLFVTGGMSREMVVTGFKKVWKK